MRSCTLATVMLAVAGLILAGCAGGTGSSAKESTIPPGGGGGGGGGTGETVPGNIQLGLAASPEAPRIAGGTSAERQVAQDVNDFRQQNGLSALAWSDAIADAERSHAYDCIQRSYFGHGASHDPDDYGICVQRGQFLNLPGDLWECGYGGGGSGAVLAWANSSAHRAALLTTGLTQHGVGIGPSGSPTFWASLR
jgi:uncharacterized protein YkwD